LDKPPQNNVFEVWIMTLKDFYSPTDGTDVGANKTIDK